MELSENNALIPDLPDEAEYPRELTQRYELLECPSEKENVRTLLASNRDNAELCVVKCYLRESPLFDRGEPEALRTIDAAPMPRFLAEYSNEQMRCVLREYVPGETLFQLAKEQVFTEEEVLGIGLQLCDQLHSLHSMEPPVIHRDIKPQNVVLRPDGKAVLIDFGIARVYTEKETDTLVFGTLGFAPPEQYGFSRTDARSDIYSLGILLYWLLHHETKVTRSGRSALEKVIARCTAFDPADRFREVAEVKSALLAARPEAQKKRKRLRIAAACILLALISCGAFFSVRANRRAVSFSQPLIEQAVRLNLGLSDKAPITKDMLGQVTALYIVADAAYPDADSFYPAVNRWYAEGKPTRGGVTDLRDLTAMPNLERVGIVAQELSDISALAGQAKLNTVEFKHNYITDISVLAGMDHLTSVGINDNPVRDISPLAACPNLEFPPAARQAARTLPRRPHESDPRPAPRVERSGRSALPGSCDTVGTAGDRSYGRLGSLAFGAAQRAEGAEADGAVRHGFQRSAGTAAAGRSICQRRTKTRDGSAGGYALYNPVRIKKERKS